MLVSCVAYENGIKLADIPVADISEYVHRPDHFIWVALFEPTRDELDEMAQEFGLHELAAEDARKGHQRPKIEEYGDSLFAVLHPAEMLPVGDQGDCELNIGEVDIFVGHNYVLTVRHRTQTGFAAVRARAEREPELLRHGSGFVLYALIDNVVDRYFPVLDQLETRLETAEEELFASASSRRKIEELYGLKRELMALKHAVAPLMEAVGKLFGGRVPQICQGTQEYFRDVHDHLMRINATIDSTREMLTTAIQVNLALIGISDNEVTKRLAAYGALITVPTLIAGIYGMNFKDMPELSWPIGYPLAVFCMVAIDAILFVRFRRAKWV
ncbi:MAG TPA: magnesium/cobalt transporter CorA [Casimicrobiaceae bacterium]|nr:magnesium/cobalt transporter CorA [Casimicrobiaceae bacterium]HXU67194.1 magnesium/cobalt transporter CorA [Casimicrobiaceae bacterium]